MQMKKNTWKSFRMDEDDAHLIEELRRRYAEEKCIDLTVDAFIRFLLSRGAKVVENELNHENEGVAVSDSY